MHWHGVAVDHPVDGVPPFTQQPIPRVRGMLEMASYMTSDITHDVELSGGMGGGFDPGQWVIHSHNLHHQQAGMMSLLSYRA